MYTLKTMKYIKGNNTECVPQRLESNICKTSNVELGISNQHPSKPFVHDKKISLHLVKKFKIVKKSNLECTNHLYAWHECWILPSKLIGFKFKYRFTLQEIDQVMEYTHGCPQRQWLYNNNKTHLPVIIRVIM